MVPGVPGVSSENGLSAQDEGIYSGVPGGGFGESRQASPRRHGLWEIMGFLMSNHGILQMNWSPFSCPLGFFLCICGMYVGMHVHMCTHEWEGQRLMDVGVFTFYIKAWYLVKLEISMSAGLRSEFALGSTSSCPPASWGLSRGFSFKPVLFSNLLETEWSHTRHVLLSWERGAWCTHCLEVESRSSLWSQLHS